MKNLELTQNEIYFLAYQMMKLWKINDNKHKTIYDKAIVLFDDKPFANVISSEEFQREYECEWIR